MLLYFYTVPFIHACGNVTGGCCPLWRQYPHYPFCQLPLAFWEYTFVFQSVALFCQLMPTLWNASLRSTMLLGSLLPPAFHSWWAGLGYSLHAQRVFCPLLPLMTKQWVTMILLSRRLSSSSEKVQQQLSCC